MPRRLLKRWLPHREALRDRWYVRPFGRLLHERDLWAIQRRTVAPAVALGLFLAFLPFPGQSLVAAAGAVRWRLNLPVAVLAVFVSNPLTMMQIYYGCYRLGRLVLGDQALLRPDALGPGLLQFLLPTLVGGVIAGAAAAAIGYLAVEGAWRIAVGLRYRRRRNTLRRTDGPAGVPTPD
jgi:hypothetical protein